MGPVYFVIGLFALTGILSLLAAVFNWNWFFATRNMQFFMQKLGRQRTRFIYGIWGVILLSMALFIFSQT